MPPVIAVHDFFGPVTSDNWHLHFEPTEGKAGIGYCARFSFDPAIDDFQALAPLLPAFETFCRAVDAHDATVRRHFETWPASAGGFELVEVVMAGDGMLPWPTSALTADGHPFALRYQALDETAWQFAGIPFFPPILAALFDVQGVFRGIDHTVEQGLSQLPDVVPSRRRGSYRHPYFGRAKFDELSRLTTVVLNGRKIPLDLFMSTADLADFDPQQLDTFVPLAENLQALDQKIRLEFPPGERLRWLEERFEYGTPALLRAIGKIFPGVKTPEGVSAEAFAAALVLKRGCFSLSPDLSGGAALTLDYQILPDRVDDELFAASFSLSGDLLDIGIES